MPTSLLGRLNMDSSDLCGLRFCRSFVFSARSATSAAHRGRAILAQARGLLEHTPMLGAAGLGQSALLPPRRNAAHTPHSGNRTASDRRCCAIRPAGPSALPHDRRVRNASPGQTHQVAMAGEPLAQAAACAAALTRRLIVLAVITKTDELALTWSCWISVQVGHGPAGDEHHFAHAGLFGCAPLNEQSARSVVSVFDVDPDEGGGLRAAQIAVPKRQRQGGVHHAPLGPPCAGDPAPWVTEPSYKPG